MGSKVSLESGAGLNGYGFGGYGGFWNLSVGEDRPEIALESLELYKKYQPELAPPWLQGPVGIPWLQTHGTVKDQQIGLLIAIVRARQARDAPWDALGRIGFTTQLERYYGETQEEYRARLQKPFEFWETAGTVAGLTSVLEGMGFNVIVIEHFVFQKDIWAEFSVWLAPRTRTLEPADSAKILGLINKIKTGHSRLHGAWYGATGARRWNDDAGPWWTTSGTQWNAPDVITISEPLTE